MAETTSGATGGEATTNTTRTGAGRTGASTTSTGSGGNATSNTTVTTGGGDTGTGAAGRSSVTAPLANLQDVPAEQNPAVSGTTPEGQLPFPHASLAGVEVNASVYKDEITEILREHEELSGKPQDFKPSEEMLAARAEAQRTIAAELRANLSAQRTAASLRSSGTSSAERNTVKVKVGSNLTHEGIFHKAGSEVMVDEDTADYLVLNRLAERV